MVYYITAPEHLWFVKELCERKEMNFEYVTNIKDIKLFVNVEIKNLKHIKFFVIDLDCLQNTDKEIYDSICGMQYMTKARVILVAMGRSADESLIKALAEINACKIILSKDIKRAQKQLEEYMIESPQVSTLQSTVSPFAKKMQNYTAPTYTPRKIESIKKDIPAVSKSMITIGICGIEPHVGTTHHALAITAYLTSKHKKACYLESNIHGDIQKMLDIYEGSSRAVRENGSIVWDGVTVYHNYSFLDILSLGYQFYVYDYGACQDITSQEFLSNDIKILVSGAKPWEFYNYNNVMGSLGVVPELYTIMNFSIPEQRNMLFIDEYEEQTYFAEFAPSPFADKINYEIYESILSDYGSDSAEKAKLNLSKLKKRFLGGFRK